MRRRCLVQWLLAAGAALLCASAAAQKKTEIVVWGVALGPDTKGTEALIREFERRNPTIDVKVLGMGAGEMNPQKLMTSIVGNVAPDVIHQDRFTVSDWASRGAFLSLDEWLKRDRDVDPLCPRPEQYYEAPWQEGSFDGKVYAIPTSADDRVLYYNKKIFREKAAELRAAGLDPDRAPRTWSELLAYSKVLTTRTKDGTLVRAGFMPNFGNSWLYMYAFMMNGDFMSPDGKKCTLYTPQTEEALKFMQQGYEIIGGYENAKKFESGFLGRENDAFFIGKVAMKIDGDWILTGISRFGPQTDFATAPAPVPDDRYHQRGAFANEKDKWVTWFGGFSYAIPKGARHPKEAWEFVKWATSTEGRIFDMKAQREWDRYRGRAFIPRLLGSREANDAAFVEFKPVEKKFADALAMHIEVAKYGKGRPPTVVAQTLWNEHVKAMESHLYGKATAKEALLAGQAAVQRDLDAYLTKDNHPEIDLGILVKIGLALLAVAITLAFVWFKRQNLATLERQEAKWAYLFISPWAVGFLVFILGPMVASLFFSFTQWDVLNEARWVGTGNYATLATTDQAKVLKVLGNAAYLAGVGVPLSLATGLAVALLLNGAARGMAAYRTFFYMPAIVPGIASAVLWTWVLTPDANKGLVNSFWQQTITAWMGIAPPGWIQSADWSKPALVVMGVWGAGSGMILWLAGLKGVPTSLYEASGIDGASAWQQFWKVTFPQLSSIVFFNMVMGFIGAMQEFDRMYVMKPSKDGPIGPDDSLLTPVYMLFNDAFAYFKMGSASAIAWVIFAIIVGLTWIQFKLAPKWVHYEADK